jgi:hypothetical protein
MLTITVEGERYELTHELSVRLAEHLWEGTQRGTITAATRMSMALSQGEFLAPRVDFPAAESAAVRAAFAALGVAGP